VTRDPEDILAFWFGTVDERGRADAAHAERWWRKDSTFDDEIRHRFLADHEAVLRGLRDAWLASPRGRLAYVLVLDQFSRNLFRDTAAMFASDDRALDAALGGIARGMDCEVAGDLRNFYYLPLMHSEHLGVQERCVEQFRTLAEQQPESASAASQLDYAVRHRDIIARFGRFPHRNALLGRASTADEAEFLRQPGSSF
jgi:uncharacterized protein (DUF924 family)